MIKRITAIIMTIIICCGVFVMPVYAVDYSTMTEGFENIDLDELTDEELEALYENPYFMEWYQQTIGGVNPNTLYSFATVLTKGNIAGSYRYYVPYIEDEEGEALEAEKIPENIMVFSGENGSYNTYYILYTTGVYTGTNTVYREARSSKKAYKITITDSTATEESFKNNIYNLIFNGIMPNGNTYADCIPYEANTNLFSIFKGTEKIYTKNQAFSAHNAINIEEAYLEYKEMDIYIPNGDTGTGGGNTGGDSGNTGGDTGTGGGNTGGDSGNTGGDTGTGGDDTSGDTGGDNSGILGWLEDIWEGITSIPEKIGEVISTVSGYLEDILEGMSLRGVLDSLGIMSNGEFLMTIGNNIAEKMDGNQFYTSLIYIKNELVEIFGADYNSYKGFVNTHPFRLTLRRTVNPNGFGETSSDSFEHFGYNEIDYGVNDMSIIGDMKWFFGTSANNNNTVVNTYNWANADGSPAVKHYSDLIIGAFMWVAFAYYMWLRLPDLISGDLISITHSAGNEIRDAKPTEYKTLTYAYDNNTGEVLKNTTTITRKEKKR